MADLPQLTYFELRGRAEVSRLLLTHEGVAFNDVRISAPSEWQSLRPTLPFGALPLYQDEKVALSQSQAIVRYLARDLGLLNLTNERIAAFDEANEALVEAQEELWRFAWRDEYASDPSSFTDGILSWYLSRLESLYRRTTGRTWLVDKVTHIECLAFVFLDELRAFFPETLHKFTHLHAFHQWFSDIDIIAKYIESGRRPVVFGMGMHGPKVDPDVELSPGAVFENPWGEPIALVDHHG